MGASWSFLLFFCFGASQGGCDVDFVAWNWIRQRPFMDSIKLHLIIGVIGLLLFFPFYHKCSYDLSQCGWNSDKSSFGTVVLAMLSGFLLGFATFGVLSTWSNLRSGGGSSQDSSASGVFDMTYSPLGMGGGAPPVSSTSMI